MIETEINSFKSDKTSDFLGDFWGYFVNLPVFKLIRIFSCRVELCFVVALVKLKI